MGSPVQMDFGGLTLVCDGLRVGATAPGQEGSELTGTEIAYLDGLTIGTVTASKGVVVDSNKDIGAFRNVVGVNFDAGASGTAGTVDVFPSTASKGKIQIAAVANSGDTTSTLTNAAQTATATWTIPDTNGNADFVMTAAAQTVGGAKTFSAAIIPSGGVATALGTAGPRLCHTGGEPAIATTSGNDSTPSTTETYYCELFVPCNMSVTGVAIFNGSNVTGNLKAYLTNSAGTNLAATASTAGSGTDAYQRIPFVGGPIAVKGPATYYTAVQYDSATARYNTHAVGNFGAGKDTGSTYGTFPTPTIPTTFTANLGNIASLY